MSLPPHNPPGAPEEGAEWSNSATFYENHCSSGGRFLMKTVADTLCVSRSNLVECLKGRSKPRGPCHKSEDAELLSIIRRLVDQRPTYGYQRIAALLNRERRAADRPVVNTKRVHRIMGNHAMFLEKHTAVRKGRFHDGKVMVIRSNLRWCSDGLEFTCWNAKVIRLAFIIDAFNHRDHQFTRKLERMGLNNGRSCDIVRFHLMASDGGPMPADGSSKVRGRSRSSHRLFDWLRGSPEKKLRSGLST